MIYLEVDEDIAPDSSDQRIRFQLSTKITRGRISFLSQSVFHANRGRRDYCRIFATLVGVEV